MASTAAELHRRASEVFLALCELEDHERAAAAASACGGDGALRREVESLLANHLPGPLASGPWASAGPEPARAPVRIDGYTVTGRLGEGGMGVVYRARQETPAREIALKVLRPGAASATTLRRFRQEVEVLGRLRHRGVAQIYAAGTVDLGHGEQPYFAMELVEGRPLTAHAAALGLDRSARLGLLADVCDAVHHAHQRGVIHRDLKPDNILVTDAGEAKVLDFGVARALDADAGATLRTETGQIVGTAAYMSPEQASGDPEAVDIRSDVYALGVIGYELLAERLPYDVAGRSLIEVVRAIRDDPPARLSSIRRGLRGDVETIVRTALHKEKSRRYQSAAEFSGDLRRCLRDEPITARPPSAIYELNKLARRNKGLCVGLALAFAAMMLGTAASVWSAVEANRLRSAAERGETRAQGAEGLIRDLADRLRPDPRLMRELRAEFGDEGAYHFALVTMAGQLWMLGEYDAAEPLFRQAVGFRASAPATPRVVIEAKNSLAVCLRDAGRSDEAVELFREVIAAAAGSDHDPYARLPSFHSNLASALIELDRFDEARRALARAAELRRRSGVAEPPEADLLLALIELGEGAPASAERRLRRLVDELDDRGFTLARLHAEALVESALGESLLRQGRFAEARDALAAVRVRLAGVLAPTHRAVVQNEGRIAALAHRAPEYALPAPGARP